MKGFTIFLPLMMCVFAVSAAAAPDLQQRFARLDKDGNGSVTWAEAYQTRANEFLVMDANRDGVVVGGEFGGRALPMSSFDVNGDGKLERSEYVGQHHRMFDKFDQDRSGAIELEEFAKAQAAVRGN